MKINRNLFLLKQSYTYYLLIILIIPSILFISCSKIKRKAEADIQMRRTILAKKTLPIYVPIEKGDNQIPVLALLAEGGNTVEKKAILAIWRNGRIVWSK